MPKNNDLALQTWNRYEYCRDNGHTDFVTKADKCERFFAGDQWAKEDLAALAAQRRPALTINKIMPTMSAVMGEQIRNRAEISFRAKNGAPTETADTLAKVFKHISDENRLDWLRSSMFDDGVISSRGFLDIRMDYSDSLKGEVKYTKLNPKNVIIDPDGEDMDPDTWSEVFTTKWVTADDIAVLYSTEDADILRHSIGSEFAYGYDSIETDRDRFGTDTMPHATGSDHVNVMRNIRLIDRQYRKLDKQKFFVNPKTGDMRQVPQGWDRNRIALIVDQFGFQILPKLVRRIRWTVIADAVVLHDDWSPYDHFTVVPYFPYFRHGRTLGLVENLLGPQELLNKTTSQELHIVNSSANGGWKVKTGALANMTPEELEQQGAKTGLVIETTGSPDEVEKIQPNQIPQGLDRLSYKAEEAIKSISNVSDSVMGQDRADVAGKAIEKKQQASQITLIKPLDNLTQSDYFIARNTLCLVQRHYTEERLLTITHNDVSGTTEELTINQMTPEGTIANDLTIGEYAVIVTSVPVRETLEDSEFEQIVSLREMGVDIPEETLLEASRLRNKKAVLEKMAARANSPEAQQMAQIALETAQLEVEKLKAEIAQLHANAGMKGAATQHTTVKAQKEAATPIEAGDGGAAKAQEVQQKGQLEAAKIEQQERKIAAELEMKREEMQAKAQLEQEKAAREAQQKEQEALNARLTRTNPKEPT